MTDIVINRCVGGFSVSRKVWELLLERGSSIALEEQALRVRYGVGAINDFFGMDFPRDDPLLIAVIREIGEKDASGPCASLKIITIPDDVEWEVHEDSDGIEWISEKHRTWGNV